MNLVVHTFVSQFVLSAPTVSSNIDTHFGHSLRNSLAIMLLTSDQKTKANSFVTAKRSHLCPRAEKSKHTDEQNVTNSHVERIHKYDLNYDQVR